LDVVRARSIEIIDSKGVVRIRLNVSDSGDESRPEVAFVELMDQTGGATLVLCGGLTPPPQAPDNWSDLQFLPTGPYISLESMDGTGVTLWLWQDRHESRGIQVTHPDAERPVRLIAGKDLSPRLDHGPDGEASDNEK